MIHMFSQIVLNSHGFRLSNSLDVVSENIIRMDIQIFQCQFNPICCLELPFSFVVAVVVASHDQAEDVLTVFRKCVPVIHLNHFCDARVGYS
jgi:hypothetical protein